MAWAYYLITHCQDETTYYRGFSELHDRHKDLEICHINLCPMPRCDASINIDSTGYSLVNYNWILGLLLCKDKNKTKEGNITQGYIES